MANDGCVGLLDMILELIACFALLCFACLLFVSKPIPSRYEEPRRVGCRCQLIDGCLCLVFAAMSGV